MIAHIFTCSLGLNQWRSFLKCTERENAENAEKSSSSIRLKQVTQLVLNPFFFFFPRIPPWIVRIPPWARSDPAKAVLECPPLAQPRQGTKGRSLAETEGKEKGAERRGRTDKILIFEQMLRKIRSAWIRCVSLSFTVLVWQRSRRGNSWKSTHCSCFR